MLGSLVHYFKVYLGNQLNAEHNWHFLRRSKIFMQNTQTLNAFKFYSVAGPLLGSSIVEGVKIYVWSDLMNHGLGLKSLFCAIFLSCLVKFLLIKDNKQSEVSIL